MSVQQLKSQTGLEKTKPAHERAPLLAQFGERYSIDPAKVLAVLKDTAFKASRKEDELSLEEMQAALIVANQHQLNPFTKEIYAFRSQGKLLIVVSVDGWSVLVNRQKELDGIEFFEKFDDKNAIFAITCKLHRKDRSVPTVVSEYLSECKRNTVPWNQQPIRMLRHRAFIQCARLAFSIAGVMDEDDAQRMPNAPLIDMQESARTVALPTQPSVPAASVMSPDDRVVELFKSLKVSEEDEAKFRAEFEGSASELVEYLEGIGKE